MLSTLLNYRLYAADMPRTLARIEADATVSREARYYAENIGRARSVDDLLADYRLYSYAMKAHGLAEQIPSKALVRQVLESDLSDPSSFANRLADPRYRTLAASFDFTTAAAGPAMQSQAQTDRLVEAYSEHLVRGGAIAGQKAAAFEARIGEIASVDELLADPALLEVVAKIAGLDPQTLSAPYLAAILSGDVPAGAGLPDGLRFLSSAFAFEDGRVPPGGRAQSAAQTAALVTRYFAAAGQAAGPQAAAAEARYVETAAGAVRTVEALLDDETMFKVVRLAAGLPDGEAARARLVNLLSLPADHPDNPIARLAGSDPERTALREKLTALKAAFAFENGAVPAGRAAIEPDALNDLLDRFQAAIPTVGTTEITLRTNSFRVQLTKMQTINNLLGRDAVYGRAAFDYILKAFDIDPATESTAKIRRVLTSDASDPNSYVRRLDDERYEKLAAAFNFDTEGRIRPERLAQPVRAQQETASLYAKSFGDDPSEVQTAAIRRETIAYLGAVGAVSSLDDLLAEDDILAYALKAYGLADENLSKSELRRLLTSDVSDPASFARSFADARYEDFARAFSVTPEGRIATGGGGAQGRAALFDTQQLYLLRMLEETAGQTSEGTRLALYFLRNAPEVKSALSILADRALFEVVRTALGLPQSMSQLDIDRQASIIEQRLDVADFQDPKALDRFIARFAALYDINNPPAGASSPILALFGGGTATGGIAGLF